MNGPAIPADTRPSRSRRGRWTWLPEGVAAVRHALVFFGLMVAGLIPLLALAIVVVYAVAFCYALAGQNAAGPDPGGHGLLPDMLILASLLYVRPLAGLTRRLTGQWCGIPIARPYLPVPGNSALALGQQTRLRLKWLATDPATWRDLLWLPVSAIAGSVLVLIPMAMALYGLVFAILPALGAPVANIPYVGILASQGRGAGLGGVALSVAGLWLTPRLLPAYGQVARLMLGPTRQAELASQVQRLTRTRSDYIDTGAAELRRIERDLHDGAQARLVAMGMTLDAIEQQIETSPDAARALVAEAKESSVKALAELRDLVRGIHPPVLADRGVAEAVRALALDSPLPVRVCLELPGRPPAPVESAAYFAVSELLANVSKHAGAREAWIDIRYSAGLLGISVCDDGHGGADSARGSGLRGIERRLSAFDGVLAISSPPGGPTVVNLEIPCALSSPKTSSF